jgi:hypothetical protein
MSASQAPALDAIALQLAAALDSYDRDAAAMVARWPDMDLYRGVSEQVERIRMYSAALPAAAVQWVELLIAHAELVHLLWQTQSGARPGDGALVAQRRERHSECVRALRLRCLALAGQAQQRSCERGADA